MKQHELKTWQPWFDDTLMGRKTFEFRKNDRDFQKGDRLLLREYNPHTETYSGTALAVRVTYIIKDAPDLPEGYCIMGIERLS
jgi:hypothetical protein